MLSYAHLHESTESELDEDSNDDDHVHHTPQPGVDDGFFVGTRAPSNGDDPEKEIPHNGNDNRGHRPSLGDVPNFPFAPGLNPNIVSDTFACRFNVKQ